MYVFDDNSKIQFFRLIKREEENYYIVGRKETEIYITTDKIGFLIISLLEKNCKIKEVKNEVKKKHGNFNVDNFVSYLLLQGFIETINRKKLRERIKKVKTILNFVDPKSIQWVFSRPMYLLYILIFLSSLSILITNPNYFPIKQDYFVSDKFAILLPIIIVISWILLFLHEFMHFIAAKSYKLPTQLGLSNRLFFLVATTDITNIYSLKREKRYRIILAGIFTDVIIFSLSIILLYLNGIGILNFNIIVDKILKFVTFSEFLGILWQFLFFMKTDIYYAFENFVKVYNLNDKAENLIRNGFYRLFIKNHHLAYFETKKERKIVNFYALLFLSGIFLLLFNFLYYYLPITLSLIKAAWFNIWQGLSTNNYNIFYDGMLFIILFLINYSLLAYGTIRHYRLYLRPRLYYFVLFSLITTGYLVLLGVILSISVLLNSYTNFYIITSIISLLFALFLVYLVYRIDKFDIEDVFVPE